MMKSRKKEFKRKYFGSLTHQLILISICLVTGTLLLCWFINTVFLEPYYVINKQIRCFPDLRRSMKRVRQGHLMTVLLM